MNKELTVILQQDKSICLEWEETQDEILSNRIKLEEELYAAYKKDINHFLFYIGFTDLTISLSANLNFIRKFSNTFIKKLSLTENLEVLRENAEVKLQGEEIENLLEEAPFFNGVEYLNSEVLQQIWNSIYKEFQKEIKAYDGKVQDFISGLSPSIHIAGRVYFHLVENNKSDAPFAFLATYTVSLNKEGASQHIPLKNALVEYGKNSSKLLELLSTITLAAKESNLMDEFLSSGEIFHPLSLNADEALQILKEIPIYEKSGIICRIPNWWKNKTRRVQLSVNIGNNNPSHVGMDALLDFDAHIMLGSEKITLSEAKQLLRSSDGLSFIKGKWVEVDADKLNETINAYEQALQYINEGMTLKEALQFQMQQGKKFGKNIDGDIGISNGVWLETFMERLVKPELIENSTLPSNFKAQLREYQKKGMNWLCYLNSLPFGACLADDMGLGKTVQLLAFLSIVKDKHVNTKMAKNKSIDDAVLKKSKSDSCKKNPHLLILPASLIANWINEIRNFAPDLQYFVAHPQYNELNEKVFTEEFLSKYDILITTYSLIVRNENFTEYVWNTVILDEAQNIKNHDTKQTKAVKKLKANNRIIMTGTPIENRLSDLWSLFDFINPGLLGNAKEFGVFAKQLKNSNEGYGKLKKIISPFILRRLKTDKSIIKDLPDKIEMKTYSLLSKKQIVLYEKQVNVLKNALNDVENEISKKGLVLASLMRFKQLCNHPDQFLGQNTYLEEDSGKFQRLREVCETIHEKRERVLVFTQFAEIIEGLKKFLDGIFCHEGLVLHGGVDIKKRKEIVEKFSSTDYVPFMVLSLKAGGVGLNLTNANHVIHFDRWWNPAVENQATDRAFRIGQKKNVVVHKFITKGTIEEKIDAMIEDKTILSGDIIGKSAENFITELDNKKLMELFTLSL